MSSQVETSPGFGWCLLDVPAFDVQVYSRSGACIDQYTVRSTELAGRSVAEIERIVRDDARRTYPDGSVFVITGNEGARSSCQIQMTLADSD